MSLESFINFKDLRKETVNHLMEYNLKIEILKPSGKPLLMFIWPSRAKAMIDC